MNALIDLCSLNTIVGILPMCTSQCNAIYFNTPLQINHLLFYHIQPYDIAGMHSKILPLFNFEYQVPLIPGMDGESFDMMCLFSCLLQDNCP